MQSSAKNAQLPIGAAAGDLGSSYPNPTVISINGNPVSTQTLGSSTDGYVLTWSNADGYYKAKQIPIQTATGSASGDLSGSYPSPTVVKLQGIAVNATAPTNGQLLTYDTADGYWRPQNAPTSFTAGGDLTGTSTSQTVSKINGNSVSAQSLGASQDGYTLTWSNADGYYKAKPNNPNNYALALTSNYTNNTAALTNTNLSFPVNAGETWKFEFYLSVVCSSGGGGRWAITGPSSSAFICFMQGHTTGYTTVTGSVMALNTQNAVTTNNLITALPLRIFGTITAASTGVVTLQGINITAGQTITVNALSNMLATKVKLV